MTARDCYVSSWSQCLNTFGVNRSDRGSKSLGRIARDSAMYETKIREFAIPCMKPAVYPIHIVRASEMIEVG